MEFWSGVRSLLLLLGRRDRAEAGTHSLDLPIQDPRSGADEVPHEMPMTRPGEGPDGPSVWLNDEEADYWWAADSMQIGAHEAEADEADQADPWGYRISRRRVLGTWVPVWHGATENDNDYDHADLTSDEQTEAAPAAATSLDLALARLFVRLGPPPDPSAQDTVHVPSSGGSLT